MTTSMGLRDYQAVALEKVEASASKRVVLVSPTGSGKSVMGREWTRRRVAEGGQVLMLAHRIELLRQFQRHMEKVGIDASIIAPGEPHDPYAKVQCASLDTLISRGEVPKSTHVIWDECFPAGTMVTMADGTERDISLIEPGEATHCGGLVVATSLRSCYIVVTIEAGGESVRCTEDHPIYVKGKGYVPAKEVVEGDLLCVWRELRAHVSEQTEDVWGEVQGETESISAAKITTGVELQSVQSESGEAAKKATSYDVWGAVSLAGQLGDDGKNQHYPREQKDEVEKSYAHERDQGKGQCVSIEDRSRPEDEGRKWERPNETRSDASTETGGSGRETKWDSANEGEKGHRLPDSLQTGPCSGITDVGDRDRRFIPHCDFSKITGQEKNRVAHWQRVDRVEVLKQGSEGGAWESERRVPVYNLQTERGCYVAGNILVHNCHHSAAETWKPIITEALPDAVALGLTATPQRSDGKALGEIFSDMVVAANYSELLRAGHIAPCRVFRPAEFLGGDFAQDAVEAYLRHGANEKGFVFARSVKDSKELAHRFTASGVPAENIDGAMSDTKRQGVMDRFANGETRLIVNVFVLTEGVDVPDATVCLLARGAGHAGTYLQMVGRVLRTSPGKSSAIFIDLPGVSHMHGLPTADREYCLSGRAIRTTGESLKNCPECGCVNLSAVRSCTECGFEYPRREYVGPKIWNMELLEYFENVGELDTAPKELKVLEWDRLMSVAEKKGFGVSFAVNEYEKIFKARPVDSMLKSINDEVRVRELKRLLDVQRSRGLKVGFISHAYKNTFGRFPSRELRSAAGVPLPSQDGL